MTQYTNAFSSFAVKDLGAARRFYEETLDLPVKEREMGFLELDLEGTTVMVYPKDDHVPATFTVLNLAVADIDEAVDRLRAKGVQFQRYDGFKQDDKDISRDEMGAIAWFTDPSDNVMAVLQM